MTDRDHLVSAIYNALRNELSEAEQEASEEIATGEPSWMDGYVAGVATCVETVRGILMGAD